MNHSLAFARAIRNNIGSIVRELTVEQLNEIPSGFNNNIAWHLGHIVVSTELLCYVRSNVVPQKEVLFAEKYRNGTRPEGFVSQNEVDELLMRMFSSLDMIEEDYKNGMFSKMEAYATHTFGIQMTNIEMVLAACSNHDALHSGHISAMSRLVIKK
jgi:hypothetical protein